MALIFKRQPSPEYDARVAFIQLLLQTGADGLFGPTTEGKVKEFQQNNGITGSGEVDEVTGAKLKLPYWITDKSRNDLVTPIRDPNKFPAGHEFVFKSEVDPAPPRGGAHFSHEPDRFISGTLNKRTVRALRTNNPGALNISNWQKFMPGYVGKTLNDGSGNETTIYVTPEKGVIAWHELIVVLYSQKPGFIQNGTFSLKRLARAYAGVGLNAPDGNPAVDGYLAGWKKWSDRIPDSHLNKSEIDPTDPDQLMRLAIAMFSHEASFATPLIAAQVANGVEQAQLRISGAPGAPAPGAPTAGGRLLTLETLRKAPIAGGEIDPATAQQEEEANGRLRADRMLRSIEWKVRGLDVNEASETAEK